MFFKRNKKVEIYHEQPFERAITSINESKYGVINDEEYEFIKLLFYLFQLENLHGYLKVSRLSSKALDVYYDGYPIGKVKLNGRKKWFMFLSDMYNPHNISSITKEDYELFIKLWIRYIKRFSQDW